MVEESPADLVRRIESGYSLPHLSTVATRLVEIASDDTCSAEDVAELIEKDPSLAVGVLRLANSAFFPTSEPIATLSQAVVNLGLHRLRVMALNPLFARHIPNGQSRLFGLRGVLAHFLIPNTERFLPRP